MALFALICIDKPGALELRLKTREAHLAYIRERGLPRLGGPLLDANGDMAGSLMIIEAEDLAAAEAFSAGDPYAKARLFERVEIRPWRVTVGQLA
jgi:hypothetical protein